MKELLEIIARGLVQNPDGVRVEESDPAEDGTITFTLFVDEEDKGRVIGKQGKIAKSIRTVMRAAATRENKKKRNSRPKSVDEFARSSAYLRSKIP